VTNLSEPVNVGSARSGSLESARRLSTGFMRSSELYPGRPALEVAGTTITYRALRARALSIAAAIRRGTSMRKPLLTGIFAHRSPTAFVGVLGALLADHGYVPLNPAFPPDRTRLMLERSQCQSLIVDRTAEPQLDSVLPQLQHPLFIVMPERNDTTQLASRWPLHTFLGAAELEEPGSEAWEQSPAPEDAVAYLLFTSGSSGIPKGVKVAHRNVTHFVDVMVKRYQITEHDRFSQTFEMTFDLSAFDMFLAWERGACVCCPSQKTMLNPSSFIQKSQLTVWFSVPSVGLMMKQFGALKPNLFPTLRWSLFCGEPLPSDIAIAWAHAAPNSELENLYGPTEVTIACSAYRWHRQDSPGKCERNIVPIGYPLPGMKTLVVDEHFNEVRPAQEGELLMAGPQVSLGYLHDPERTMASFVVPPGQSETHYRTGDRVLRPVGNQPMVFLGRVDDQIKVQGHRVELGEIEACLKKEAGVDLAIAVGWPLTASGAGGVEAFVANGPLDLESLREKLKTKLPRYAVPRRIHAIEHWPLNSNGKIDRQQLLAYLDRPV
jgi:amino acid adenylation domain-containing protein